jgi:hypothetical protein
VVLRISLAALVFLLACDDGPVDVDEGTTSTGAGGATTGPGGGGAGGDEDACVLGELGSCGSGSKCSVVDPVSGEVACVTAGAIGPWATCNVDTDCVELTYCDSLTGVCKPLCDSEDDCPGDGRCVQAHVSLGEPITGLSLCTAGCQPLTGDPCAVASGDVACIAHNPGDDVTSLDCAASGGAPEDAVCSAQTAASSRSDCDNGLMCVLAGNQQLCKRWCSSPGSQAECDPGETCSDAGVSHMGTPYGVCP